MIIMYYSAVRADRHVNAGLRKIFVTCGSDLYKRGRLTSAYSLLLTGDADRTAADTDLYKVRTSLGKEAEAVAIDNVAGSYLDAVTVSLAYKVKRLLLPAGVALGCVDAENIHAGVNKRGNALCIVTGIYTRADHKALLPVKQLLRIFLMLGVVLAEDKIAEPVLIVNDGERVQLIVPDYIICLFERGVRRRGDKACAGRHELRHLEIGGHTGYAVVSSGNDTEQVAVVRTVVGDGDSTVTVAFDKREHISQRIIGGKVGVAYNKACLVALYARYHGSLILNALRTVDKGHSSLTCERYCHPVIGYRLHHSRHKRYVEIYIGLFTAAVLYERRSERYV